MLSTADPMPLHAFYSEWLFLLSQFPSVISDFLATPCTVDTAKKDRQVNQKLKIDIR